MSGQRPAEGNSVWPQRCPPDFSRDGVRLGLEKIQWLPAAKGHEGTLPGFGIQDRDAWRRPPCGYAVTYPPFSG